MDSPAGLEGFGCIDKFFPVPPTVCTVDILEVLWGLTLALIVTGGLGVARLVRVRYLSRKVVHIFVGVAGLFVPFVFRSLTIPLTICLAYSIAILWLRARGGLGWISMEQSMGEVYFAIMLPLLLASTWNFDIWLGVTILSYMAFGDAVTGIVRYYVSGRRAKGWEGTVAMLIVSTIAGYAIYGYAHGPLGGISGVVGGVVASLVERVGIVDDNVLIPSVTLPVLVLLRLALGF